MGRTQIQEVKDDKNCSPSKVKKYKASVHPRCNNGRGCNRCWDKYNELHLDDDCRV